MFLHPSSHIKDTDTNITYVVCDSDDCFQATCCSCKTLLADGIEGHVCKVNDSDQKFKDTVNEKGYKECFVCGATVELAEGKFHAAWTDVRSERNAYINPACNHITCECGNSFCYICGKGWPGAHGCPQYGPAQYDSDGFNQNGYHRDTGLNPDGRTFREQMLYENVEDENEDEVGEDDGQNGDELEDDLWHQILRHIDPARRATLESVDPEEREDVLMQLQIELIDAGIIFNMDQHPAVEQQQGGGDDENEHDGNGNGDDEGGDENESDSDEEDEEDGARDDGAQQDGAQQDGAQQDGAQDGAAQDGAAQHGAAQHGAALERVINELWNAEVLHGVDPGPGDGEDVLNLFPIGHRAWNSDLLHIYPPYAPELITSMAGSPIDSDAPSPDGLSQDTASNVDSSATSPEDLADRSDQEDSLPRNL
jgi:hypothetical protein